jgi:peptidoglycan/LPS O-acetylase OafA/YrhL
MVENRVISNAISSAPQNMTRGDLPLLADQPATIHSSATQERILTRHRSPLGALTGLRFFAASYVIIFHSRLAVVFGAHGFHLASNFFGNGYLAVPLFFMLSGFILAYNYRGQIGTLNQTFRFWEARFARIWPAYVFSLLCSSFPLSNIPPLPIAVSTLCMVQSWNIFHPEYAGVWNFVCWTLSVEAFFYLVFPLLQLGLEKVRLLGSILFGFGVVLVAFFCNTPYHNFTMRDPGPWFYIPAPVIHLPEFITGVLVGNLFLQLHRRSAGINLLRRFGRVETSPADATQAGPHSGFPFLTLTGFIGAILILCTPHGYWEGLILPAFGVFLYGLAAERTLLSRFLSMRLLLLGGEISYAMYLLRTPMHQWVLAIPSAHISHLVEYLYLPFGLVPFSLLCFYFIEGPSRRALRRFFAAVQSAWS